MQVHHLLLSRLPTQQVAANERAVLDGGYEPRPAEHLGLLLPGADEQDVDVASGHHRIDNRVDEESGFFHLAAGAEDQPALGTGVRRQQIVPACKADRLTTQEDEFLTELELAHGTSLAAPFRKKATCSSVRNGWIIFSQFLSARHNSMSASWPSRG